MAGATLLEAFHAIIPAADLIAHVAGKSSPAVFADWIADPDSAAYHAGADGTDAPAGYAVLTRPDLPVPTDTRDIDLRRLYPLTAFHGTGLGPALMAECLAAARKRGHRRVLLGVHPDNRRARAFYERSGFRVIGERIFAVGASRFVDPIYARAV